MTSKQADASPPVLLPPLLPDSDIIQHSPSTLNTTSSYNDMTDVRPALSRPLQYVESSASTSGDEICPHNPQQHPVRKPYGDKKKFSDWYDLREYSIEQLSEYDDDGIVKPWHRTLIMIQPIVVAWVFITYAVCYSYRIWCNYQFRLQYGGLADASWTLVVVEGICIFPHMSWMTVLLLSIGNRKRSKLRLRGHEVPTVDVLLTTCGEVVPMILNTIRGACNIDYPRDRYRIIICDDAADVKLEEAVKPLQSEYPHLLYQARAKIPGVPHHYKAGNLQSGIDFAANLFGGPAEYLATLDADMIPDREWLRALLPHLLRDSKLGLICPPQTFWNVPADDPLCQSLCEFIHYMELRKDHIGAAWCTGSGAVFKRFIIDNMGGWPTSSMAEDQQLSCQMNGEGYKTAYLHEFMQVGMVPEDFIGHLKQRTRWAVGTLQTAGTLRWGFPNNLTKCMTFPQRWCIFIFALNTMMAIPMFIAYFIIPALLFWGRDLMVYTTTRQLRWQLRLCAIWTCSLRISEIVLTLPSGYIHGQRSAMAWQFMMPYIAVSVLRCYILPTWLGGKKIVFLASGAIGNQLKERSAKSRAGVWTRIRLTCIHCRIWFFIFFVVFCFGAAGLDWYRAWKIKRSTGDIKNALMHILVNSMLPPMWWLFLAISYLVPIAYMLFPPTVPEQDDMMDFDPKTGAGQPKHKQVKQVWGVLPLVRELCWGLTFAYCLVLFVGTFVY